MARHVCKRLEPVIEIGLMARPKAHGGYTELQGYRTALGLCAAACVEFELPDDEIHLAVQAAIEGFRARRRTMQADEN